MSAKSSPKPTPEEEEAALLKLQQKGVQYSRANEESLKARKFGADFQGNLTEFSLIFEWAWEDAETKVLIEKATGDSFSGWIHIQDDTLDPQTYPGQEQKIKFEAGIVKFIESVESNEATNG